MSLWIGIGLLLVTAAIMLLTDNPGHLVGLEDTDFVRLISGIALLIVIGSSTLLSYRGRGTLAAKQAATWLALALAVIAAYSYRAEFSSLGARIMGELTPGKPVAIKTSGDTVAVSANENGQFKIEALVNNTHVTLLTDTGATVVVLAHDDARRVGVIAGPLDYTVPVKTANGRTMSAPVRLDEIRVGSITLRNIRALIAQPGQLETSLLGMSFLGRLSKFEISGNRMVLKQ